MTDLLPKLVPVAEVGISLTSTEYYYTLYMSKPRKIISICRNFIELIVSNNPKIWLQASLIQVSLIKI